MTPRTIRKRIAKHSALLRELGKTQSLRFDSKMLAILRGSYKKKGGLYQVINMRGGNSRIIYVGKSKNLLQRIYNDLRCGNKERHPLTLKLSSQRHGNVKAAREYLKSFCKVQLLEVRTPSTRTSLEHFAIAVLDPKYND